MPAPLQCPLRARDRAQLEEMLSKGVQQVRVVLRALALLHLHRGGGASAAGRAVGLTPQAVRLIAKRYREGGLAA
ncbi:MAG: helix-turn-helix domain-containing protein, partial [Gemmatimonadetes bacterium]|nr:helix-turn-helix domain-containing protein [Gemmatimonadota bacterium]